MISSGLRVSSQPPHFARKTCVGLSLGVSAHPSARAAHKATNSCATASKRRSASSRVIITTPILVQHSCGLARMVFQESTKPLATLHWALAFWVLADCKKKEHVALAL